MREKKQNSEAQLRTANAHGMRPINDENQAADGRGRFILGRPDPGSVFPSSASQSVFPGAPDEPGGIFPLWSDGIFNQSSVGRMLMRNKMIPVKSNELRAVGYDGSTLIVEFRDGRTCKHRRVPCSVYRKLMDSILKGPFYNASIRGKYGC